MQIDPNAKITDLELRLSALMTAQSVYVQTIQFTDVGLMELTRGIYQFLSGDDPLLDQSKATAGAEYRPTTDEVVTDPINEVSMKEALRPVADNVLSLMDRKLGLGVEYGTPND